MKMFRLVVIALGIGVAGCTNTAGIEGRKAADRSQVKYRGSRLEESIEIKNLKMRKVGGILQASGTMFSNTTSDLTIQYRFSWYDKDGFELDKDAGTWQSLKLYGRETADIQGVAPNGRAEEFKIVLRELK